ncbi:ATP-binding protein [Streptomyces tubercidicus]|uniref:ATP-binding protein n=1 Tax=Streptomyces tubercidicus TaxID=47759 RepID=UPI00368AFB53
MFLSSGVPGHRRTSDAEVRPTMPRRLSSPLSYGFRVTPARRSVTEARRRVLELVRRWHTGMTADQVEELSLLTSEVVTNAVSHSGATCAVCVRWTGVKVRVEVTDANPQLPHVVSPTSESENGRGLWLVTALATSWGAKQSPAGKVVWFEIAIKGSSAGATSEAGVAETASRSF